MSTKPSVLAMTSHIKQIITRLVEAINFQLPGGRWQLFEFCDLWIVPEIIKHCAQATLTAQWTTRLPLLQRRAPAELAADAILAILETQDDESDNNEQTTWTVLDFCSGAGGPTPAIEATVNQRQTARGKPPITFQLSDLHPHLSAWQELSARSPNLSFIPYPVDASNPPSNPNPNDNGKVLHLFSLSLHHFPDSATRRILARTLETSSAFAILELQSRDLISTLVMMLEPFLLLLSTIFWFPRSSVHLLLTYGLPVLPLLHGWDGFVSCLRTRTFTETMGLVGKGEGRHEDWVFGCERRLHTWPLGYMNVVFGKKVAAVDK